MVADLVRRLSEVLALTAVSTADVKALLREDFFAFMLRSFAELHGGQRLSPAWHAEVLALKLQGVGKGEAKRLIVNVPPRRLKSLAASVALPAWLLGQVPALAIVNVTYAQDLSEKFARDCRAIMTSDWYQALFPTTRLASPRPPFQELATTRGGFRMATSVGGVLTGRGADVILIDDPLKPSDAMSQSRRAAANEWFEFDALFASQRQAEGRDRHRHAAAARGRPRRPRDERGRLRVVSFPAIAEEDETHVVEAPLGKIRTFRRATGEALDPEREPLATLAEIRATIGEMNFAAQYQQRPAPSGGGMVKDGLAPPLFRGRTAGLRPDRPELGHRQQAERAFRLFRLHHLGTRRAQLLSPGRLAEEALLSRVQTRRRSKRTTGFGPKRS